MQVVRYMLTSLKHHELTELRTKHVSEQLQVLLSRVDSLELK